MPGVRSAEVDWEAGTAVVQSTDTATASLIDAVEDTGKDCAEMRSTTLAVDETMKTAAGQ